MNTKVKQLATLGASLIALSLASCTTYVDPTAPVLPPATTTTTTTTPLVNANASLPPVTITPGVSTETRKTTTTTYN